MSRSINGIEIQKRTGKYKHTSVIVFRVTQMCEVPPEFTWSSGVRSLGPFNLLCCCRETILLIVSWTGHVLGFKCHVASAPTSRATKSGFSLPSDFFTLGLLHKE